MRHKTAAVAPDTLITLSAGLLPAGEAFGAGKTKLAAVEIRLRSGHRLVTSAATRVAVAGSNQLAFCPVDALTPEDYAVVALRAGGWNDTSPPLLAEATLRTNGPRITVPERLDDELAYLLGAFCAVGAFRPVEVVFHSRDDTVRQHLADIQRRRFGVTPVEQVLRGRQLPELATESAELVAWLHAIGVGGARRDRRIPPAMLQATRKEVIAFLQGLSLGASVSDKQGNSVHWRFDSVSRGMVDDVQVLLTQLGVLTITEPSATRSPWRLSARGQHALALFKEIPFVEEHESTRLERLRRPVGAGPYEVVPGAIKGELYNLLPIGQPGNTVGPHSVRKDFSSLRPASQQRHPTRYLLEKLAGTVGMERLPDWIQQVLHERLYFLPVREVRSVGSARLVPIDQSRQTDTVVANGLLLHR